MCVVGALQANDSLLALKAATSHVDVGVQVMMAAGDSAIIQFIPLDSFAVMPYEIVAEFGRVSIATQNSDSLIVGAG